jgi:nucleoside-diphosphate-sugar epimerase
VVLGTIELPDSSSIIWSFLFDDSFVGSHLVDRLMLQGHEVIVADNFFTGRKRNIEHWIGHENFELINHDIVNPLYIEGERPA